MDERPLVYAEDQSTSAFVAARSTHGSFHKKARNVNKSYDFNSFNISNTVAVGEPANTSLQMNVTYGSPKPEARPLQNIDNRQLAS